MLDCVDNFKTDCIDRIFKKDTLRKNNNKRKTQGINHSNRR